MGKQIKEERKKNGVYYTPNDLADFLAKELLSNKKLSVFDPSYGGGSLLLAAEKVFKNFNNSKRNLKLFGADINPVNGLLKHLPSANLVQKNFFDYSNDQKFDVILTNPPYVKHQSIDKSILQLYKKNIEQLSELKNTSDLWAYFIVKSTEHLKLKGKLGAILPWSFLQSDYSIKVREKLFNQFEEIKVVALNKIYFDDAKERVIILWLEGYGTECKSIKYSSQENHLSEPDFSILHKADWLANRVVDDKKNHLDVIHNYFIKTKKTRLLNHYADIRIGIVTGANSYFVKEKETAYNLGFNDENLVPVICKSIDLVNYLQNGKKHLKQLLIIPDKMAYISEGEEMEFNNRSHSKNRTPWYRVNPGNIPDAFFPYRVGSMPFLILNDKKVQSLNSVHRIYFKNLNLVQQMWIQISLISIYGQLFLNKYSKNYGRKMIKMEPGSLYKIPVCVSENEVNKTDYDNIIRLIIEGEKQQAVLEATNLVNREFKISNEIQTLSKLAWQAVLTTF